MMTKRAASLTQSIMPLVAGLLPSEWAEVAAAVEQSLAGRVAQQVRLTGYDPETDRLRARVSNACTALTPEGEKRDLRLLGIPHETVRTVPVDQLKEVVAAVDEELAWQKQLGAQRHAALRPAAAKAEVVAGAAKRFALECKQLKGQSMTWRRAMRLLQRLVVAEAKDPLPKKQRAKTPGPKAESYPSVAEVAAYCEQMGYTEVVAADVVRYYTAGHTDGIWRREKNKKEIVVQVWQRCVDHWHRNGRQWTAAAGKGLPPRTDYQRMNAMVAGPPRPAAGEDTLQAAEYKPLFARKESEAMIYSTCPGCGANLDPGEKCDCRRESAGEKEGSQTDEHTAASA